MLTFGFVSAASSNSLTSLVTRVLMPPHKPLSDEIASSSDDSGAASSSAGASFVSIRPLMDAANTGVRPSFVGVVKEQTFGGSRVLSQFDQTLCACINGS